MMKRLPIIRHIRYFWHVYHFNRHMDMWSHFGYFIPQQADLDRLDAIWRGEA